MDHTHQRKSRSDDQPVELANLSDTVVDTGKLLKCNLVEEALCFVEQAITDDFKRKIEADWDVAEVQTQLEELFASKVKEKT